MTRRPRLRRVVLVAAALAGLSAFVGAPAAAAGEAPADALQIRSVDATDFPEVGVAVQVIGTSPKISDFTLRENGSVVSEVDIEPIGKTDTRVGVVLLVDVSDSMKENGALDQAKKAAKAFVAGKHENQRVAVVSFGANTQVVSQFTADESKLEAAIDGLVLQGGTSLWDGLRVAAGLFDDQPNMQPNVVLLSDGKDTDSDATADLAKGDAFDAGATVYSIALAGSELNEGALRSLADDTGGQYLEANKATELQGLYGQVQVSLQNQYLLSYTSKAEPGSLDLSVSVAGLDDSRKVNSGSSGYSLATAPREAEPAGGLSFFQSSLGKWLGLLLGLVAVVLVVYAVGLLLVRDKGRLSTILQPYDEGKEASGDEGEGSPQLAETKFLQRAVQLTTQMADRKGFLPKLETSLERADLPLRPGEALFFYLSTVAILFVLATLLTRSLMIGLMALLLFTLVPPAALKFLQGRRRKKFMSQLPDTLQLLAGSLRAGYSLMQGLEAVSQEVEDPMGRELRRVVVESRLGRPLEESLDEAAARMGSADFGWAVMAIRIQREVGGNLSELLLTVADTMVARERLRRDVSALTAEGKISAIVLGMLPVGLGAAMYTINPGYIGVLFSERIGNAMLGGAILLALAGFYWMRKTIQIEV